MCAHTTYLNRWSSRDDERRAVMAHARCSWWGMAKPPTVSLSPSRRNNPFHVLRSSSFRRTFIFSRVFSLLLLFTSQQTTTFFFFSFSFFFFFAVRSFRARERREEAQNDDTQTQTKEVSARVLSSDHANRKRVLFLFFFCLGFLYQKNP